jgi:hypothetical protein
MDAPQYTDNLRGGTVSSETPCQSSSLPASVSGSSDFVAVHVESMSRVTAIGQGQQKGRPSPGRASSPGRRVRIIIERLGVTVDSVARHCGIARPKLSAVLNGTGELRADWLESMPPAVVREYVTELARSVELDVVPLGDASGAGDLHTLVREASDVMRVAALSESDGHISVAEAREELREIVDLERTLACRKARLNEIVESRGAAVMR